MSSNRVTPGTAVKAHEADTTSVHGITDTSTLYRSGGTDVALADGGTGASSASVARTNLGVPATSDLIVAGRITGRIYPPCFPTFGSNGALTRNTLYAIPFNVGASQSFDRIGIASIGVATSLVRLGIYTDSSGRPGALVVDAGTVDTGTLGEKLATISVTASGVVWVAAVGQGSADPQTTRFGAFVSPLVGGEAGSMYAGGNFGLAYSQGSVSGALPDPWGSTFTVVGAANTVPVVGLRAA